MRQSLEVNDIWLHIIREYLDKDGGKNPIPQTNNSTTCKLEILTTLEIQTQPSHKEKTSSCTLQATREDSHER